MRTMIDMTNELELAEPAAETWIQIMKTGSFQHQVYGDMKITQNDLLQFKENFDKQIRGVDLAVDVNHEPGKGAVGWFKELKVEPGRLMARVAWTERGKELISSGEYKYFSPEFAFTYKDAESGKVFKDVLLGGGITNRPFLKNMDPIELSEDGQYAVCFAESDPQDEKDPDDDDDDDRTTDPEDNPDWLEDVKQGVTKWPTDPEQVAQLIKAGVSKDDADKAYEERQKAAKKLAEPPADGKKQEQEARAKKYGIGIKQGGAVTKPEQYSDVPDEKFADPVNFKYPITPEYAMAAYRYFAKPANQEDYSAQERKTIASRIVAALPEANRDEAKKTFKLDDDGGTTPTNPIGGEGAPVKPTDDVNAGKFNEPAGGVNMDEAVKLAEQLTAEREARVKLEEQVRRMTLSETVKGFMFNESTKKGKILPAQYDSVLEFAMSLDDTQIAKFSEIVNALPDAISFNEEHGHGNKGKVTEESRADLVEKRKAVLMSEGHDYKTALAMADAEIPQV